MAASWKWVIVGACAAAGCSPPEENTDDVYPRNCGIEGPVDLLRMPKGLAASVLPVDAGSYYLVRYGQDYSRREAWTAERCGASTSRVDPVSAAMNVGVVGDEIIECDQSDPKVFLHDPAYPDEPRRIFDSAAGCRVVAVGSGLAAQSVGSGEVWFLSDPKDASAAPALVTDQAVAHSADEYGLCQPGVFNCRSNRGGRLDVTGAGDQLLVQLDDLQVVSFSTRTLQSRLVSDGPVDVLEVLDNPRFVMMRSPNYDSYLVDLEEGRTTEFCCTNGRGAARLFDDWLVAGLPPPSTPPPAEWTTLQWLDIRSREVVEFRGAADWTPLARLSKTTLLLDVGVRVSPNPTRYIFWPASAWLEAVDLTGDDFWSSGSGEGVYALQRTDGGSRLSRLASPDDTPRLLLEGPLTLYPTHHDKIVYTEANGASETAPLHVLFPDGDDVEIEPAALAVFGMTNDRLAWPIETDEVFYTVPNEDGTATLRRTVLP